MAAGMRLLLRFPHGFGDAVQLTVVLEHLRRFRPDCRIDVQCKRGMQSLFNGQAGAAPLLDEPIDHSLYAEVRTLAWAEPTTTYGDSPSTKAEVCLREEFRLQPLAALCRYRILPDEGAKTLAQEYLTGLCGEPSGGRFPVVLIHYQGNSARTKKNLDERIVRRLCRVVRRSGHLPVLLDWDRRSGLLGLPGVHNPGPDAELWRGTGTGDGGILAALTGMARLMVGIDSGPAHVAGATETETIVTWRRHHPVQFFGLSPNVMHLVPWNHESFVRGEKGPGLRYFAENYRQRTYRDLGHALPELAVEALSTGPLTMDADHWVRRAHRQADMDIVRDVYLDDCYGVGEAPIRPRYAVDVGAHIGSFARRLHQRFPQAKLVCVEANAANVEALRANAGQFARIENSACGYEGRPLRLLSTVYPGTSNTGGSTVVAESAPLPPGYHDAGLAPAITLEEIQARQGWPRIDLLKLDCEGSEYSILKNCDLDRVGMIVGEYHGRQRFERLVRDRFSGWNLRILRDGDLGIFWLRRSCR